MSEMKYLKVADRKWAGYTGVLGLAMFKDGVSVEMMPRHQRDKMAAAMQFIEIDAEGNEMPAGAAYRMISEYRERAPKVVRLETQTEGEKAAEISESQLASAKTPSVLTRDELEAIASKSGIKGLREIGGKWNVKHRSIPTLIEMILNAQENAVGKIKKVEAPVEPIVEAEEQAEDDVMAQIAAETAARDAEILAAEQRQAEEVANFMTESAAKEAAASGDLAAAINAEDSAQE